MNVLSPRTRLVTLVVKRVIFLLPALKVLVPVVSAVPLVAVSATDAVSPVTLPECAPSLVTLLPAVSAVLVVTVTLVVPVSVTSLATPVVVLATSRGNALLVLLVVSVVVSVALESATTVARTVTSLGNALRSRARPVTLAASPVTSPLPVPALVLRPLLPKPLVVGL